MTVVLGLDIGGTTSRGRLSRNGQILREGTEHSASLPAVGERAATHALEGLLKSMGLNVLAEPRSTPEVDMVCVGTAGSETQRTYHFLADALRHVTAPEQLLVVSDSRLVLPAAGLIDGIAVLAGTGSVAVGSCGDRHLQTGGWGYLLGDEGSGYWIVKRAVHLLLDASRAESRHQGFLLKHLQETTCTDSLGSLLQYLYDNPQSRKWAAAAPAVFAAAADGDTLAGDVVASAAHHLAGYALRLQAELGENLPVVLAGGVLTSQPDLAGRVESLLLAEGFADVSVLRHPPVVGAVRLAEVAADRAATQSKATSSH